MIFLRDYQADLVEKIRKAMRSCKAILLQLSTGAGKTAIASFMVRSAAEKGSSVFFCVHRRNLIRQTSKTFDQFGVAHSFIAAKYPYDPKSLVHICSIDTLRSRLETSPVPKIVFVDECHMANSNSWSAIIEFYANHGTWIIGLTASPWRTDGSGMGKHFNVMIQGPTMAWLIENGFLSKYRMFAPSKPDLSGVTLQGGDYAKNQLASKLDEDFVLIGDAVKHYKKYAPETLAIAYCVSRRHSQNTAEKFREAGIAAQHIDGETPDDERVRIIEAFANREILVLTNVALISTGFDLASQVGRDVNVETIIDLAPTKSLSLYLQKIGRGLRYKQFPAILLDHAGNSIDRHGLPCDEREWTLEAREKKKRGSEEKMILVRQCMECYFVHKPAPQCPNCEFIYPVVHRKVPEIEGELEEVTKAQKKADKREQGMARTVEDLMKVYMARGTPAWRAKLRAQHVINARMKKKK